MKRWEIGVISIYEDEARTIAYCKGEWDYRNIRKMRPVYYDLHVLLLF